MPTTKKLSKSSRFTFLMRAFADDPESIAPTNAPTNPPPVIPLPIGTVNYEDLIANARKDEKAKLYPEIEKWKTQHNSLLLVVAERDKLIGEQVTLLRDAEKALKIAQDELAAPGKPTSEQNLKISQLEQVISQMQTEHAAALNKLELENFKNAELSKIGTANLIPELVTGNTKEEITASIEVSKARYLQYTGGQQQQAPAYMPNVPPANPSLPNSNLAAQKTADEIARMTHAEYKEWRKIAGIK